jgi:excisionase family DNA binding protein
MEPQKTLQLINTTPEELEAGIGKIIATHFGIFKEEFKPKYTEELLTRNEVADTFKVDLSTVHNWTKKGKLKAYGLGHRVYYKRSEIENALKPL